MDVQILDLDFQGQPHTIASYLIDAPEGPVLVETGPVSALEACLARLAERGIAPEDVRHVLVTHIHLDHAGAAGWWASRGARVYVHANGAQHLIDPSKLLASATRIYGDDMQRLWGDTVAAPADRVTSVPGDQTLRVAGLDVRAIDAPGHAGHHLVYVIDGVAFTGDAAGVRIDGQRHIDLPAVPPEFDREAWYRTIDRLAAENLVALYPTHFGRADDVPWHLSALGRLIGEATGLVQGMLLVGAGRDEIVERYVTWNRERAAADGVTEKFVVRSDLANPLAMSVDGIGRYWKKRGVGPQ